MTPRMRSATCAACAFEVAERDGTWRMLAPEAAQRLERFLDDYRAIRAAEGRGSDDDAWYRALPSTVPGDAQHANWRIRAASFAAFADRVLEPLAAAAGRPLVVLDLGAGPGWLSNRVAERGHVAVGVDVSDDGRDGLGAWPRYTTRWLPVQADFDHLPFADGEADLVIFNASLHYSVDVLRTLGEALRVTRPSGSLVILDTPVYRDESSGRTMLAERATEFERRYGRRSDSLPVEGFLSERRIGELESQLGIRFERHLPWAGIGWAIRPWRARLRGHREPARFPVLTARRP